MNNDAVAQFQQRQHRIQGGTVAVSPPPSNADEKMLSVWANGSKSDAPLHDPFSTAKKASYEF